jgi:tetratricopeptide (TPR) repeat protein
MLWMGAGAVQEMVQALAKIQLGGPFAEPRDLSFSDPRDLQSPVRVTYRLDRTGFVTAGGNLARGAVPASWLALLGYSLVVGPENGPRLEENPLLTGPQEFVETFVLDLEEGDSVTAPAGVVLDRDFARYESTYTVEPGVFRAIRTFRLRFESLPLDRKAEILSFGQAMVKDLEQELVVRLATARDPRAVAQDLDASSFIALARAAHENREWDLAQEFLQKATQAEPTRVEAWVLLGAVHLRKGEGAEGLAALEKARELAPGDTRVYRTLAWGYRVVGRFADGIAAVRQGLAIDPLDALLQHGLAWFLEELEDWAGAAEAYDRLVSLRPDSVHGLLGAARTRYAQGNFEAARERVERSMTLHPSGRDRIAAARILAHPEIDPAKAEEVLLGVMREAASSCRGVSLDHVPDDYWDALWTLAVAYRARGEARLEAKQFGDAIKNLKAAYDMFPEEDLALLLAEAHSRKGDPETGFRYFALTWEARRRDRKPEVPSYLRGFVTRKYPDQPSLDRALETLGKEHLFQDKVETAGGPFRVPEKYPGDQGQDFKILLLVDENGLVEAHRAQGGHDPFLAAAIRDLPRIRFAPVGLPEAPVKTLRVVEFFYLPVEEVRAFWKFAPPPARPPAGWMEEDE